MVAVAREEAVGSRRVTTVMKRYNHRIRNARMQNRLRVVHMASLLFVSVSTIAAPGELTAQTRQANKAITLVAVVSRTEGNDSQGNMDAVVLVEDVLEVTEAVKLLGVIVQRR